MGMLVDATFGSGLIVGEEKVEKDRLVWERLAVTL